MSLCIMRNLRRLWFKPRTSSRPSPCYLYVWCGRFCNFESL